MTAALWPWSDRRFHRATAAWWSPLCGDQALGPQRPLEASFNKQTICVGFLPCELPVPERHLECVEGRTGGFKSLAKPRSVSAASLHPSHLATSMLKLFLACVQEDQIDLKANLHGGRGVV